MTREGVLVEALNEIEGYEIDWSKGPADNINAVAEIARKALVAVGPLPLTLDAATVEAAAREVEARACRDDCGLGIDHPWCKAERAAAKRIRALAQPPPLGATPARTFDELLVEFSNIVEKGSPEAWQIMHTSTLRKLVTAALKTDRLTTRRQP